uniref:Uncharacterized protein n=1 Tax=CrAss-like virus sp. ctYsL76 TaxID=2826826 RepID=A0A8S5QM15_9CAUD|nr:MAG TPA: hypothetical protein [CrAss-like virus sp. ctYsL76]
MKNGEYKIKSLYTTSCRMNTVFAIVQKQF